MRKSRRRLIVIPSIVIASLIILPVIFFVVVFMAIPMSVLGDMTTIYRSPESESRLMAIYDKKLGQWPVPYESILLDTSYGKVNTIVSGPQDAPALVLLHASGMSASSWLYNMEFLNRHYRTYAIDNPGEAGRSSLSDINNFPADGKALSDLYVEITDKLGVPQASVAGASNGGFIATNLALYYPERVSKLILLGPMGYSSTTDMAGMRIALVASIPTKPLQDNTVLWAFGDNPKVLETSEEWMREVMTGTFPRIARPTRFTPEQLQNINVPVLLILGDKDSLLGAPENASSLAKNIPDIEIKVVNSGHLISVEQTDQVNQLIYDFLGK